MPPFFHELRRFPEGVVLPALFRIPIALEGQGVGAHVEMMRQELGQRREDVERLNALEGVFGNLRCHRGVGSGREKAGPPNACRAGRLEEVRVEFTAGTKKWPAILESTADQNNMRMRHAAENGAKGGRIRRPFLVRPLGSTRCRRTPFGPEGPKARFGERIVGIGL